jgi:hypothetical protein
MAHIKNRDTVKLYWINLARCFFLTPPGFIKDFKRDSEILCDNRVKGIQGVTIDSYSELLLQESLCKSPAIKGLAFSDSFRAIENRLDALDRIAPEKHRFALSAGLIAIALLGVFVSDCVAAGHLAPAVNNQHEIIVTYAGEDYDTAVAAYSQSAASHGEAAGAPSGKIRPPNEFFDGTYEILKNGDIRLDLPALQETVKPLEQQGERVAAIHFVMMDYNAIRDSYTESAYGFYFEIMEMETAGLDTDDYLLMKRDMSFDEQLFIVTRHWL